MVEQRRIWTLLRKDIPTLIQQLEDLIEEPPPMEADESR